MFGSRRKNQRLIANDVAKEIGRRGFPAKTETVTAMCSTGNVRRYAIVIPGRGVAAIDNSLNIAVISSNKLRPWSPVFEYENVEAAAENILRNLPMS